MKSKREIKKYPLWKRLIGLGLIILAVLWFGVTWFPEEMKQLYDEVSEPEIDMSVDQKLEECGELCVGNDTIPVIKHECKVLCNNLYYYFGEEELDKYLEDMRK